MIATIGTDGNTFLRRIDRLPRGLAVFCRRWIHWINSLPGQDARKKTIGTNSPRHYDAIRSATFRIGRLEAA